MKVINKSEEVANSMLELMHKAESNKLSSDLAFKRARIQLRAASVANTALANIRATSLGATSTLISAYKVSGVSLDTKAVVDIIKAM